MWPCVGRIPWWGICRCDSNVDLNVCRGLLAACAAAWWRRGGGGAEGRHGLAREVRQWERGRERVSVCLFVTLCYLSKYSCIVVRCDDTISFMVQGLGLV